MATQTIERERIDEVIEDTDFPQTDDGDNDVRSRMIAFIKQHFEDYLGDDMKLLEQPGGLKMLARKYRAHLQEDAPAK